MAPPEAGTPPGSPPQRKRTKPGKPVQSKRIPRHLKWLQHKRAGTGGSASINQEWNSYAETVEPLAGVLEPVLEQEGISKFNFLVDAKSRLHAQIFYVRAVVVALLCSLGRVVDALMACGEYTKADIYAVPSISRLTAATALGDLEEIKRIVDRDTNRWTFQEIGHLVKPDESLREQKRLIANVVLREAAHAGRLPLVEYALRQLCDIDSLDIYKCQEVIWAAVERDYLHILLFMFRFLSGDFRTTTIPCNYDFVLTIHKNQRLCIKKRSKDPTPITVEDSWLPSLIYSARGNCLWWLLRQPGCDIRPSFARSKRSYTEILWNIYEDTAPDPLPVWRVDPVLLDLRCRRLGNRACQLVANCLCQMEERENFQIIDLSENPRIGPEGVNAIVRCFDQIAFHLREIRFSDLPVRCHNTFRLLARQQVYRIYEMGLGRGYHKFLETQTYPTLEMCVEGDFKAAVCMKLPAGQNGELDHICVANGADVKVVCPFPSLVTIVSWWIADRIRKPKKKRRL